MEGIPKITVTPERHFLKVYPNEGTVIPIYIENQENVKTIVYNEISYNSENLSAVISDNVILNKYIGDISKCYLIIFPINNFKGVEIINISSIPKEYNDQNICGNIVNLSILVYNV